ncbi:MAG: hypothetical protein VYC34_08495, partial [Planctomycetota bacterium]|nr:hypothetical protein [Planctomycetota bacterium]
RKLEETMAIAALEDANSGSVRVIQRAMTPLAPAGPRKLILLALAAALSLFAAASFVAVAEFFDHRVYTREEVEKRLGAPVMASIPRNRAAGAVA